MVEELRKRLMSRPFEPFSMVVSGGLRLDVTRQFQVAIGRTQLSYAYAGTNRGELVKLDRIVALEPVGRTKQA